jgi:hypothetical protein
MRPWEAHVSVPDLELTARLIGLPLPELWSRYLAVGGSSTLLALADRVAGTVTWSPREELFLAVALNDALLDECLVSLNPLEQLLEDQRPGAHPAAGGGSVRGADAPPGNVPDLDALIVRSRDARASARKIRRAAQEVRQRLAAATQ